MKREDQIGRLKESMPLHARLKDAVVPLVQGLLKQRGIEFLGVTGRVKTLESASNKLLKGRRSGEFDELMDITGIRVVTYFDSQVAQISEIIREAFTVDEKHSYDRSSRLGLDRLGYRSVHFICTLGERRAALPEFADIGALKFEVQVRTVLQHAWAELAHDRAYKFPGVLPPALERELNLYSGMLEIADAAFDNIAARVDAYKAKLVTDGLASMDDLALDSINIKKVIDTVAGDFHVAHIAGEVDAVVVDELRNFGIKTVGDFRRLIAENGERTFSGEATYAYPGVIRDAMMFADIDKYFDDAWAENWRACEPSTIDRLSEKYPDKDVEALFNTLGIYIDSFDDADYSVFEEDAFFEEDQVE